MLQSKYSVVNASPLNSTDHHADDQSKQQYNSSLSSSADSTVTQQSNSTTTTHTAAASDAAGFHSVSLNDQTELNDNQSLFDSTRNDSAALDNEPPQPDEFRLLISIAEFQSARGLLRTGQIFCSIIAFSCMADVLGFSRFIEFEMIVVAGCVSFVYTFGLTLVHFFIDLLVPQRVRMLSLHTIEYRCDLLLGAWQCFVSALASRRCSLGVCAQQRTLNIEASILFSCVTFVLLLLSARQTQQKIKQLQLQGNGGGG